MTSTWKDRALAATRGTQLGAIIACSLSLPRSSPMFNGKASITSDGFVMCDFTDTAGVTHMGAFVGAVSDLNRNVEGLATPEPQQRRP